MRTDSGAHFFCLINLGHMNLTEFKRSEASKDPHYLLFGHPVEHSLSPLMHNLALDYHNLDGRYYAIDLQSNELTDLASHLNREHFLGANVTIPYKQLIGDYLDQIDHSARQIGAVNTIRRHNYTLEGYNTDYYGFRAPLEEYEFALEGSAAIVFGTGGAARAIVVSLLDFAVERIYLVSRNPNRISSFKDFEAVELISYQNWTSFVDDANLIVNATPLGMYPNTDDSPVHEAEIEWLEDRICYDIVYNPLQTTFLSQADKAGATTIGGLEMLIHQAAQSFKLWTDQPFPTQLVRNRLYEELAN